MDDSEANVWVLYRDFLSPSQYLACFIAGGISSVLSVLGSLAVCKLVIQRHDRSILDRLMLGLSVSDVITSVANYSQPFVLPTYTEFPYAIGNNFTCQFSGFWLVFMVTSGIYAAGLAVYFYCFVLTDRHHEWPRRLEKYIHGIAWITGLVLATASVWWVRPSLGLGVCLVTCGSMNKAGECIDPPKDRLIAGVLWNTYVALLSIAAFVGIGFTVALCRGVKRQQDRNSKYYTTSATQMPREVAIQAVFYVLAYINSLIGASFAQMVREVYARQSAQFFQDPPMIAFVSLFVLYLLLPLQGFLNCLVYIRPRLLQWKKTHPDCSWFWCFLQTLQGKPLPLRHTAESPPLPAEQDHDVAASNIHTSSNVSPNSTSTRNALDTPIDDDGDVCWEP